MRTRTLLIVAALLGCWVRAAGAQQATGQQPAEETPVVNPYQITLANWLDAGFRITSVTGDEARFERYRDPRTGPFLDRFRFEKETGPGKFAVALDNVGYRDQRLFGQFIVPGKVQFSAEWNQIPQFMSVNTRSPYSPPGAGDQRLPAGAASAVQGGQSAVSVYNNPTLAPLTYFDTRARRDTLTLRFLYTPTTNLDVNFDLSTAGRTGNQPWAMSFGFGQSAEVTSPVDQRTTDMNVGAEWANDRGMVRVNYDGSWFTDSQQTLIIDSPLRVTDASAGAARGRMALFPSNNAHTVTGAGAINLPANSRLTGSVSIGTWRQNEPLLPVTTNSALVVPGTTTPVTSVALPRSTADADVSRFNANFVFSTRPYTFLDVVARYRRYDFTNNTADFTPEWIVQYDASVAAGDTIAHFDHTNNMFEAEATITSLEAVTVSGGYRLDRMDRTERVFGLTSDNVLFASVDSTNLGMLSLHGIYEHGRRRGSNYDEAVLTDAGEYPGLRRFDLADRDRNRVTAMAQVMPTDMFSISGSLTVTKDTFPNEQYSPQDAFGLQDRNSQGYAVFFDATPRDTVMVGAGYGYQIYKTSQQSRQVSTAPTVPPTGPQLDPLRNWTVSEDEKVHYISANAQLTNLFPKTAVRITYDYNRSEMPYTYALAANSVLTAPVQLSPIFNRWHTFTADARYFLRKNLAAGVTYWLDKYTVDDNWSMGAPIEDNVAIPGILLVGYGFRPYTANSVWLRVMYIF